MIENARGYVEVNWDKSEMEGCLICVHTINEGFKVSLKSFNFIQRISLDT